MATSETTKRGLLKSNLEAVTSAAVRVRAHVLQIEDVMLGTGIPDDGSAEVSPIGYADETIAAYEYVIRTLEEADASVMRLQNEFNA